MKPYTLLFEDASMYLLDTLEQDFHCSAGVVPKEQLIVGKTVMTKKGVQGHLSKTRFVDGFRKLKRGAQIITPKDIGHILAHTFVDKQTVCIDAGAGSGAMSCALAHYAKKVYCYDVREDHLALALDNAQKLGLKNVVGTLHDVYSGFKHKADVIVLDLPEPYKCVESSAKALSIGGYLVCYVPGANQMHQVSVALMNHPSFHVLKSIELIEREWKIGEKVLRPQTNSCMHTGFLVFAKKVKDVEN
ncbi:MAG: tRNA (adenine-N1)-methyltransferase [Candidatus Woesearchaeota archaeon]